MNRSNNDTSSKIVIEEMSSIGPKNALEERLSVTPVKTQYTVKNKIKLPLAPDTGLINKDSSFGNINFKIFNVGQGLAVQSSDPNVVKNISIGPSVSGVSTITADITENSKFASRKAYLVFTDTDGRQTTVRILQEKKDNAITIDPSGTTVAASGGSGYFNYDVVDKSSIVRLMKPSQGWITDIHRDGAKISYTILENKSKLKRKSRITLTCGSLSESFEIEQEASAPSCSLNIAECGKLRWDGTKRALIGLCIEASPISLLDIIRSQGIKYETSQGEGTFEQYEIGPNGDLKLVFPANETGGDLEYAIKVAVSGVDASCDAHYIVTQPVPPSKPSITISADSLQTHSFEDKKKTQKNFVQVSGIPLSDLKAITSGWVKSAQIDSYGAIELEYDKNYAGSARTSVVTLISRSDPSLKKEIEFTQGYSSLKVFKNSTEISTLSFRAASGSTTVAVKLESTDDEVTYDDLIVNCSSEWVSAEWVDSNSITLEKGLKVSVKANPYGTDRQYSFTVGTKSGVPSSVKITVVQAKAIIALSVTPSAITMSQFGGDFSINVTAQDPREVSYTTTPSFVKWVKFNAYDSRYGIISFHAMPQPTGGTCTIHVTDGTMQKDVTVTAVGRPMVYFDKDDKTVDYHSGTMHVNVYSGSSQLIPFNAEYIESIVAPSGMSVIATTDYLGFDIIYEENGTSASRAATIRVQVPVGGEMKAFAAFQLKQEPKTE